MATITSTRTIVAETCGSCGILFGLDQQFMQKRRDDGALFTCPNGHRVCYNDSAAQRLAQAERFLKNANERLTAVEGLNAKLADDLLDKVKENRRIKRRAAAGLCLKCNRSFTNVKRHNDSKHKPK